MTEPSRRSVAAVGAATDPRTWSGIPYHFWRAATRLGFATDAVDVPLVRAAWQRRLWAAARLMQGRRPAGFQYSAGFLDWAERHIPAEALSGDLISFSQHFPRAATVRRAGGRISYYIDATFAALASGRGLDLRLPSDVAARARALERENYSLADRVVTMARWAAASVIEDCGVPAERVHTVLPGANLELPAGWQPPPRPTGLPGRVRPLALGFIGMDWRRKGLPIVCALRDALAERGCRAVVRVIGAPPPRSAGRDGVEFLGCIDKRREAERFVSAVAGCDLGCLFSAREAFGISTLEFLRLGVPVAGYAIEGPADALPTDAGFRFVPSQSVDDMASELIEALDDPARWNLLNEAARRWSPVVTWDRCVKEMQHLWDGKTAPCPARPWLGPPVPTECESVS